MLRRSAGQDSGSCSSYVAFAAVRHTLQSVLSAFSSINLVAIIVAVIANMAVGMIWFSPRVFGIVWMDLAGLTPEKIQKGGGPANAMLLALVMAIVTAVTLSILFVLMDIRTVQDGITVSLLLGIGLLATSQITHGTFENRPLKLTAITLSHEIVGYIVMGIVLALWR